MIKENCEIFAQRKELKSRSHKVLRSHYFLLVFLTLVLSLFGLEATGSLNGFERATNQEKISEEDPGSFLSLDDVKAEPTIWEKAFSAGLKASTAESEPIPDGEEAGAGPGEGNKAVNGVLANLINAVGSGQLFVWFIKSIQSVIHSERGSIAVFIILSFLFYMVVFTFIRNVYSAAVRRLFLEARTYEKVSFLDILYFAVLRKWVRASWTMLAAYVYELLWWLTIVGGCIKRYSYFAVPYIVAENPSLTAKEAITLSRKMMDGHKKEAFFYEATLLGWMLLGYLTLGISDLLYGAPYMIACRTEFYVKVREDAIKRGVEGIALLDDPYLFEKADKILRYETYFEVVDEITIVYENRVMLPRWKKFIADWFGAWVGTVKGKRAYDVQEDRLAALEHDKLCMEGKAYPEWLDPHRTVKKTEHQGQFSFIRSYTIWTLFLLFITFCFAGWCWEVALHFMQFGEFVNRGTMYGPWLPIYGSGGILVMILCARFRKNPVAEFFVSLTLCGILEYISSWQLEMRYHQRWWSYDGYFLNLHGRICAEGLLVFGIGCCAVVYLIAPVFDFLLSKVKEKVLIGVSLVLAVLYGTDFVYSNMHPNMAKGAIEAEAPAAQTQQTSQTEQ